MGETSGNVAIDLRGRVNGSYSGGYALGQMGALTRDSNPSVSFDGTASIILGTSPAITTQLDDNNAGTIEAWVYSTAMSTQAAIVRQGADAGGYGMFINTDGSIQAFFGSYFDNALSSPPGEVSTYAWYHLVATWDGTRVKLYKNGALIAIGADHSYTWTNNVNRVDLGDAFGYTPFYGRLDEIAIYRSALSPGQVATHYSSGEG